MTFNIFQTNILNLYGHKGQIWLNQLPRLIAAVTAEKGLHHLRQMPHLSFNYVASGFRRRTPIILKLGLDRNALNQEALALKGFAGCGSVLLLDQLELKDGGGLILQQALPGTSLDAFFPEKEDASIDIACNVIKRLHQAKIPKNHQFLHIRDVLKALDHNWDVPSHLLEESRKFRDELLDTATTDVLLHGDLHHKNILKNGDDWIAIDPKGFIGEPAYEIGAFIRNPAPMLLDHNHLKNVITNRIVRFSHALELPPVRVFKWCFVQTQLAWIWALEDRCETTGWSAITDVLRSLTF